MIPVLHNAHETQFDNNGIGPLSDAKDCTVERDLNGMYELEMQYPITGALFGDLESRFLILAKPDPDTDPQPFRIYRITKPIQGTVSVYARHIAYDLMGIPVSPFSAQSAADALRGLKTHAAVDCPFDFWTDKTTQATMTVAAPAALWSLLGGTSGSVLDTYGGEYDFDRYTVRLYNRMGADKGVSIRYGKNLTTLEQDENCESCYTGVYPYWLGQDGTLVQLDDMIVPAPGEYDYVRVMPLDLSQEWQEAPTPEQLRLRATQYISENQIGIPDVSWAIGFVQLEQTEEYKGSAILEQVILGDTVSVDFPKLRVSAAARAVATKYKPLLDRYEEITLGKVHSNLADTIAQQQKEVEKKPDKTWFATAMEQAGKLLLGAKGGCVRVLDTDGDGMPDTLYVADNQDPNQAVKVWRFNYEGWAASDKGYNGPFKLAATLEQGLLAEAVTAAKLTAGTIQSADGGKTFFLDLDNGILRMNSYPTRDDVQASIDILTDSINSKVTAGQVESIISQKADSIRLKASKISWDSTYSSMSENGILTCQNANITGVVKCGNDSGYWMKMDSNGKMSGGYKNQTYGAINCNFDGPFDGMGIESDNVVLKGKLWVYSDYPGPTWSAGQTKTFDVVSELSIEATGNGGVAWSYSFSTLYFENGILTTVW